MSHLDSLRARSAGCVSSEVFAENIASALGRGLPCVDYGKPLPYRVAVVAGGPSVRDQLDELKQFDGFLVAINGTHDWLIENGIIPDAAIAVDPQASLAELFKNPQKDTTYLVASNCAPEVFDALAESQVILWHVATNEEYNGSLAVCAGPSAVSSAPYLLYMIGYREIHLYGVDSSLSSAESHVYRGGIVGERVQVRVGTDVFISTGAFALQAAHLWNLGQAMPDDLRLGIHGFGLAKAIFDADGDFEVL